MKNMTKELLDKINEIATPVKIMHVCGSHDVLYLPVKLTNV